MHLFAGVDITHCKVRKEDSTRHSLPALPDQGELPVRMAVDDARKHRMGQCVSMGSIALTMRIAQAW